MLPKASETSPTPLPAAADDARADFTLGPWLVQPSLQRMVREDCEKTLGPTVLGVLLALAHRPLEAVSKDELIAGAWLGDAASDEALTTAVYELRKALGDDARSPRFIATIRGRGYRLLIRPGAAAPERSDLPLPGAPSTPQKAAQQESPPANLPPEDFLPSPSEPPSARASRRLGEMAGGLIAALVAVLLALPSVLSAPPAERETGAPRADSPLPRASAADLPSPANAEFPAPIVIHPGRDASARRSVAVLPLESRGEHQPADFARGLTERVAIDLSRSEWLDVVPSFSRTFEASVTSGAVDAVVEGAVRRHGDRVTVTVQLISITDG
ncbi:MAG: winged helix-turn-helix domain-containing protein, partial [Acidobacteriota bacterium]